MAKKKRFCSKFFKGLFYEVISEGWLDNTTYVVIFQEMKDIDGDSYHIEAEYHKDEKRVTFVRVYDYEVLDAECYILPILKNQIEAYVLTKVGEVAENSIIIKHPISIELKLAIPETLSVGELSEWLSSLEVNIKASGDMVKVLEKTLEVDKCK